MLTFDHQELGEAIIPHRFEVEDLVLDLGLHTLFKNRDDLLNGLLWSCHPKRVSFKRYGIVEKRAFEVCMLLYSIFVRFKVLVIIVALIISTCYFYFYN